MHVAGIVGLCCYAKTLNPTFGSLLNNFYYDLYTILNLKFDRLYLQSDRIIFAADFERCYCILPLARH